MKSRPWWFYKQSAVIPYRLDAEGVRVLLITSIGRGRWIIPKGVIDPGSTAIDSARKEAYEEAGILGDVSSESIGEYSYKKWGGTCRVEVFPMKVHTELESWPESSSRRREWMTTERAAREVEEDGLKKLLLSIEDSLDKNKLI